MNRLYSKGILLFLFFCVFISFWIFSRFTVDDAFITWRYGKNLLDFGIWNYNPSTFDKAQAYTNPIFAILGIVPAYLNIDVVLFFKLFSLLVLVYFFNFFLVKTKSLNMLLLGYGTPALMIHAFSGLETFLFVSLLVALFISMDERNFKSSFILSIVLMLTRPEAWLLVFVVPTFFLLKKEGEFGFNKFVFHGLFKPVSLNLMGVNSLRKPMLVFTFLGLFLAFYFLFHYVVFGSALPNTFYIKSGSVFKLDFLLLTLVVLSAFLILVLSKRFVLFILFGAFFLAMGIQYSTSDLLMNYVDRFLFHILMPVYFILVYVASKNDSFYCQFTDNKGNVLFKIIPKVYVNLVALFLLSILSYRTINFGTLHWASYYPRLLDAHGELGKSLNTLRMSSSISSITIGDAGLASYLSNTNTLDFIGLGSSLVAQNGMSDELLDLYNPEVIILYDINDQLASSWNQDMIRSWAVSKDYAVVGSIYWRPDYRLKIYSRKKFKEIIDVCESSKEKNNISNRDYLRNLWKPPFYYWHN